MATSSTALSALEAHLLWANYTTAFVSLEDVKAFLLHCYPSLELKLVKVSDDEGDSSWVIVCSAKYLWVEESPVRPARFLFLQNVLFRSSSQEDQSCILERVVAPSP